MPYTVNPKRHYKIWLSSHPEIFMPAINQLRLVKMRRKNPSAEISLVYDSSLLSESAAVACKRFCEQHRIYLYDAQQLITHCRSDSHEESTLRALYLDEITHLDQGGNLGSASDKLRLLSPVYQLGIYTDFDVDVNVESLADSIQVQAPLLMQISSYHKDESDTHEFISVNSDCLIIACPQAAKALITHIQQVGIYLSQRQIKGACNEAYSNNNIDDVRFQTLLQRLSYQQTAREIRHSIQKLCRNNETLIRFLMHPERLVIQGKTIGFKQVPKPSSAVYEEFAQSILANILKVLPTAKPRSRKAMLKVLENPTTVALLDHYRMEMLDLMLACTIIDTIGPLAYVMGIFRTNYLLKTAIDRSVAPYSLAHYGLQEAINSTNGYGLHASEIAKNQRTADATNDLSWMACGAQDFVAHEEKLSESAQKIQLAWRAKHPKL